MVSQLSLVVLQISLYSVQGQKRFFSFLFPSSVCAITHHKTTPMLCVQIPSSEKFEWATQRATRVAIVWVLSCRSVCHHTSRENWQKRAKINKNGWVDVPVPVCFHPRQKDEKFVLTCLPLVLQWPTFTFWLWNLLSLPTITCRKVKSACSL